MSTHHVIEIVNILCALLGGVAGVIAVSRPAAFLGAGATVTSDVRLYAWLYAVRAVPLSVAAIAILLTSAWTGLVAMLLALAVAQAGDCLLGMRRRIVGMAVGSAIAAVIHALSAWWIATH